MPRVCHEAPINATSLVPFTLPHVPLSPRPPPLIPYFAADFSAGASVDVERGGWYPVLRLDQRSGAKFWGADVYHVDGGRAVSSPRAGTLCGKTAGTFCAGRINSVWYSFRRNGGGERDWLDFWFPTPCSPGLPLSPFRAALFCLFCPILPVSLHVVVPTEPRRRALE